MWRSGALISSSNGWSAAGARCVSSGAWAASVMRPRSMEVGIMSEVGSGHIWCFCWCSEVCGELGPGGAFPTLRWFSSSHVPRSPLSKQRMRRDPNVQEEWVKCYRLRRGKLLVSIL